MKTVINIQAHKASLVVLTPAQMNNVKGGKDLVETLVKQVLKDDKRRERPGGGITTL